MFQKFGRSFIVSLSASIMFAGCQLPSQPSEVSPQDSGQYTISTLRTRSFDNVTLHIEDELARDPEYTNYRLRYTYDNLTLYALLTLPQGDQPIQGWPVVVFNHGYVNPATYNTLSTYKEYTHEYAKSGYAVVKPDYRCHGVSDCPSNSAMERLLYPQDVIALLSNLDQIPQVNQHQIYMVGHSMGGDVTIKVLEATTKVKKASVWAPVAAPFPESLMYYVTRFETQTFRNQTEAEIKSHFPNQSALESVSALDNVHHISTPLLIHHGTDDTLAPHKWSVTLAQALAANEKPHTFFSYEGEDHNFTRGAWNTLVQRDLQFFQSQ